MKDNALIALNRFLDRGYRSLRSDKKVDVSDLLDSDMPLCLRVSERLNRMVEAEKPIVFETDRISFMRTTKKVPNILSKKEFDSLAEKHLMFDGGIICNISSNYEYTISVGFDKRLDEIEEKLNENCSETQKNELQAMKNSILAVYKLVEKYRDEALKVGNKTLASILEKVPYKGASSYHEALVFFRILNFTLWLNANKHNTIGRFDQYMFPYFESDIKNGVLTYDEAKELTEELFAVLNYDADLFPGIQQGDNGQSLVLGGCKKDGTSAFNDLTKLVLESSLEVNCIDPKINLRVDKETPFEWYMLGTELTKKGLGFPQYSNDDIVIPALVKLGYDIEDARNYVVAACWEFIIPGVGMDIPNVDAVSFPLLVNNAVFSKEFNNCESYEDFERIFNHEIEKEVKRLADFSYDFFLIPSPFQSLLMNNCVKNKSDISHGLKYNNIGLHGAGISNAADSLAAIKEHVFEKKDISKDQLVLALNYNFENMEDLRHLLLTSPKMGNNDDYVDDLAVKLLDKFSLECRKYKNYRGGIYRAGTGTAMYYIWYSENLGATPDGRKAKENFAANFSPSLSHNFKGVLSVVQSFCKPHLIDACNGGPLTLEFHDTIFRNQEGTDKVAMLVRTFIALGGHQLQLNAINRDTLLDAQKHPEKYPNLIVRVWGWSGYFNELDLCYQNHIIHRLEFLS